MARKQKLTARVSVALSEADREEIRLAAERSDVSPSEFIRLMALHAAREKLQVRPLTVERKND